LRFSPIYCAFFLSSIVIESYFYAFPQPHMG
jgi:hypothetical protein